MQRPRRPSGQISVLIVFSLIPMFTLFAFVVNVGMLVHAKISLQNAADLAAYAGAATQARHLTQISHINYQMRQAYKRFVYKLYVIGNLSQKCFPRDAGTPDSRCQTASASEEAAFNWTNPANTITDADGKSLTGKPFPTMPAVCIALTRDSNPCQLGTGVPLVQAPKCFGPLDPTCSALSSAAAAIQDIQKMSCTSNSAVNLQVLAHWLYATNINLELTANDKLRGLIEDDVGLITEEVIHEARIRTLEGYINESAKKNLTVASLGDFEGGEQAKHERTIMALKTAWHNLNEAVFGRDSFTMNELTAHPAQMLLLERMRIQINVPYVLMKGDATGPKAACQLILEDLMARPIVGVYVNPISHVFYGVRLKAKAKVLFNPFPFGRPDDGIEMTAYAAAKPFGSRIGPVIEDPQSFFTFPKPREENAIDEMHIPKLLIAENEPGGNVTMDQIKTLRAFHRIVVPPEGAAGEIRKDDFRRGLRAAMLPDKYEIGKYNVPVDVESRDTGLGPPYYGNKNDDYTFWAPFFGVTDSFTEFKDRIRSELETMSPTKVNTGSPDLRTRTMAKILEVFLDKLDAYLTNTLKSQQNYNVARIQDPYSQTVFGDNLPSLPGKHMAREKAATSYVPPNDLDMMQRGRDGYSVKLVPFKMLTATPGKRANTGPGGQWVPFTPSGPDAAEIPLLSH